MSPIRSVVILLAACIVVVATVEPTLTQALDDCKAKYGLMDICIAARTISDRIAPTLPVRLSSEMTINTIMAAGRRVVMTATWDLTEAEYREKLSVRHATHEQFAAHMQRFTQRMACAQEGPAIFVGLGGEIQYSYMTEDGHPLFAPVIVSCRLTP